MMGKDEILPLVGEGVTGTYDDGYTYAKAQQAADWKRVEPLVGYILSIALCPCCVEDKECSEDCTLQDDDPTGYNRMLEARALLRSDMGVKP